MVVRIRTMSRCASAASFVLLISNKGPSITGNYPIPQENKPATARRQQKNRFLNRNRCAILAPMVDDQCPLEAYFETTGEKKVDFMERTGISVRTLYDILGRKNRDYGIMTLQKIETATGGVVSLRAMAEWLTKERTG